LYFTLMHRMPELQALGSGAVFVELSKSAIEAVDISFPESVDEQCHIAARLKGQLAEVANAQQAAQAQARDTSLLQIRLLREAFGMCDGVLRKVLGDHAPITSGTTPPRGTKHYWEPAEVPWVKTSEVAFAPITQTEEAVSKAALAECSLTLLPPKTVLLAMYGQGRTRGQSAILEVAATTNQACLAILPNDTWEPEFLYYWLVASYQDLRDLSEHRGGNQANLNGALLKALEVPAPDHAQQLEVVRRIEVALRGVDAVTAATKSTLTELELLPQRLLAQALEN
jgi:type I restriction enzyme S subunit